MIFYYKASTIGKRVQDRTAKSRKIMKIKELLLLVNVLQ